MDKIKQSLRTILFWCITFTAILVCGIPLIIFGAINKQWGLLATGIAFTVIGFYGTPIIWTTYSNRNSYKRIVSAITVERLDSINKIATHLNLKEQVVLERVDFCIRQEYLIGYVREGDKIKPNVKAFTSLIGCKCLSCGATFEHDLTAQAKCPYCGTIAND